MKKSKIRLTLEEIELDSFVTTIEKPEARTIEGGFTSQIFTLLTRVSIKTDPKVGDKCGASPKVPKEKKIVFP